MKRKANRVRAKSWMVRVVVRDFDLVVGGPVSQKKLVASFKAGERIKIRRASALSEHPRMYLIQDRSDLGLVSRGIVSQFLRGFDMRVRCERPERNARA